MTNQTIQEALGHGHGNDVGISDGHRIEYVETVEAYNKWAEVCSQPCISGTKKDMNHFCGIGL